MDMNMCKPAESEVELEIAMRELELRESRQGRMNDAQLVHNNKILAAKLRQERKINVEQEEKWQREKTALIKQNDRKCADMRYVMEVKLDKMKEKMKLLYTEATAKSKEKYEKLEQDLIIYKDQCQQLNDNNDQFVTHLRTISEQMYKLNEQILELKEKNEFLKNKLRFADGDSKIEMEDEQVENIGNIYVVD